MSSSASPPAPASSPSETYKILEGLVGRKISLTLLYREANIVEVRGDKDLTALKLDAHGVPSGKSFVLETKVISFNPAVLPVSFLIPFFLHVFFSLIPCKRHGLTILEVQKRPLSVVLLELTSLPSYTASICDTIIAKVWHEFKLI
jgi:hypothetical protein